MAVDDKTEPILTLTRVFDAPPELVWKAWYEPEHFRQWFAPDGFSMPHCTLDLRVGGELRFSFQNPQWMGGREVWSKAVFREVEPKRRTVSLASFTDENGNQVKPSVCGLSDDFPETMVMTVNFEPIEGGKKTKLIVTQSVPLSIAQRNGAPVGWGQTLAHLTEYLKTMKP